MLVGVSRCYLPTVFACFRFRAAIARLTAATRPTNSHFLTKLACMEKEKNLEVELIPPHYRLLIGREESLGMRVAGMPFKPLMQFMLG